MPEMKPEPTHVIDPDGEVIILLQDANAPFAIWDEGEETDILPDKSESTTVEAESQGNKSEQVDAQPEEETEDMAESMEQNITAPLGENDITCEKSFRIQVSARHLTSASPVFKATLRGPWKNTVALGNDGSAEVSTHSWDLEAFLILLKIIHCRLHDVPKLVNLELLAKIAAVAHFYDCRDSVGHFVHNLWIKSLGGDFPTTYSRDLMLWITISWVFQLPDHFQRSTSIAMTHSKAQMTDLGLPIPRRLIDEMNTHRENAIQNVLSSLQKRRRGYLDGVRGCGSLYNLIMFGVLTKNMHAYSILEPAANFLGLDYNHVVRSIRSFRILRYRASKSCKRESHRHDVSSRFLSPETKDYVEGLTLDCFVSI